MNLFPLKSALSKGGVLSSDDQKNIVINQDRMKIDRRIKTCDGWVCGVDVLPSEAQMIEFTISNVHDSEEQKLEASREEHRMA